MFPSLTLPNVRIGVSFRVLDVVAVSFFTWTLIRLVRTAHRRARTTRLNGPPSKSLVLGFPEFFSASSTPDGPDIYEAWAEEYGAVYQVPSVLGTTRIVLCDPKAIAHFYARETTTYVLTPLGKFMVGILVRFLKTAADRLDVDHSVVGWEGQFVDDTWRCTQTVCMLCVPRNLAIVDYLGSLRKSLTPAFSIAAIRKLLPIFYDSAYKVGSLSHSLSAALKPHELRQRLSGMTFFRMAPMAQSSKFRDGA